VGVAEERAVEIPVWLKHRPVDPRGYPIPFTAYVSPDGTPDFRVLDEEKRQDVVRRRLCGLCGFPLAYWIWFIGGDQSFSTRMFNDPAMHEECARYALEVCPFLVRPNARYRKPPEELAGVEVWTHPEAISSSERPKRIGLGRTRQYEARIVRVSDHTTKGRPTGTLLIHAAKFKAIEWFGGEDGTE